MRRVAWLLVVAACGKATPTAPRPAATSAALPSFPDGAIWTQDISKAPLDAASAAVIATLDERGWGLGRLQIDFSFVVLRDDGRAPLRAFEPSDAFYTPDCDRVPVPVPAWGAIEGERGLSCDGDGDCHLIVVRGKTLYEMWRADVRGDTFRGGCLAVWDLAKVYAPSGRGDQCTSADAAGFPIAPLLFSADEVAAGSIDHAIRFVLPDDRIQRATFVHPATHATDTSGGASAVPYGARLRLRADYPVDTLPSPGARVVARALQRYGMFLSDEGKVALTAESDRFTTARWSGLLGPHDLVAIRPRDFEMIEAGPRIPYTGDCTR